MFSVNTGTEWSSTQTPTGSKTYTPKFFQKAKFNSWNYLCPIPQDAIGQNSIWNKIRDIKF